VGPRLQNAPAYSNSGPAGNPLYEFCRQQETCMKCPGDCEDGCTECPNVGDCWFGDKAILRVNVTIALNGATSPLPSTALLELPLLGIVGDKAKWGGQPDSSTAPDFTSSAEYDATTKIMNVRMESADGYRWVFTGLATCAGGDIVLDPDASLYDGDETPTGNAVADLKANPNPVDGADCLTANGCGECDKACDFAINWNGGSEGYHKVFDISYLWGQMGLADGDAITFSIDWSSDTIPDRLRVHDGEGTLRIDSGCNGTKADYPLTDGYLHYSLDLTKAQATGFIIDVEPNCGTPTGQTGWHVRFHCCTPVSWLCRNCVNGNLIPNLYVSKELYEPGQVIQIAGTCYRVSDLGSCHVANNSGAVVSGCLDPLCGGASPCVGSGAPAAVVWEQKNSHPEYAPDHPINDMTATANWTTATDPDEYYSTGLVSVGTGWSMEMHLACLAVDRDIFGFTVPAGSWLAVVVTASGFWYDYWWKAGPNVAGSYTAIARLTYPGIYDPTLTGTLTVANV